MAVRNTALKKAILTRSLYS